MPDKCDKHDEIMERFTRAVMDIREMHIEMRSDMKAHLDRCDREFSRSAEHIKESVPFRDKLLSHEAWIKKCQKKEEFNWQRMVSSVWGVAVTLFIGLLTYLQAKR